MILPIVVSGLKLLMAGIVYLGTIICVGFCSMVIGVIVAIGVIYHFGMTAALILLRWLRNG